MLDGAPIVRLLKSPVRDGRVEWIGLRPARLVPLVTVEEGHLHPDGGLLGDHYGGRSGIRHLTLIQHEHVLAIASFLGMDVLDPAILRRNVVISRFNLHALRPGEGFRLGDAVLEKTGECHPCGRMEHLLGPGGYQAVRGHGGITARVLSPGRFGIGDALAKVALGATAAEAPVTA